MTTKQELLQLSKREIIRRFLDLEKRLKKIEQYLKAFDNAHIPSSKKLKKSTNSDEKTDSEEKEDEIKKPHFPGKPKGGKGGGIKLPKPDRIEEHTLDTCPISGKPLVYSSVLSWCPFA